MITPELISYIKKQISTNKPKGLIVSKLLSVGWHQDDVEEGFLNIELESKPKVLSLGEKLEIESPKLEQKKEDRQVEDFKVELPIRENLKTETPKVWTPKNIPVTKKEEVKEIEPINKPVEIIPREDLKKEELIPTLIPKAETNPFAFNKDDNLIKKDDTLVDPPKSFLIKNLPQGAMLASYEKDLLSANQKKEEIIKSNNIVRGNNSGLIKWLVIVFVIIIIIAGVAWAFMSGFVNVKNINFSFIKKDPKVLLLDNSKVLSSLKSYKTETNIEISSPSFANISVGLISGEAVTSLDKDSFSINTLGIINQSKYDIFSDNFITIKSSLLPDYITTDIKNNGSDLFVSVPDLASVLGENSPKPAIVKIKKDQFDLIPPIFSPRLESELKKLNIYKILLNGMSSYIDNETMVVYDDFINNVEIIEKGQEKIKNVDTYHYSINADRQITKKLLAKITDNFVLNISDEDKTKLDGILGATTVDSFEIWIGKGDNNIYQYHVVLDIPLSKIIGFEDKSIGDNKVTIDWKTTYYDFDISNNISMPDDSTLFVDFLKTIKEVKIKNDVSSFKQLATNLFNTEGNYGNKSNLNGSCMNPVSGSLFSPLGHTKGATTAVSAISELLNKVMGITNGAGFCYSSSKDWSFTIPISDNYDPFSENAGVYKSFYCVDNTGVAKELITPPTGVVCK